MGFVSFLESYIGDLDTRFAYSTNPTVRIRDRYLGLLAYASRLVVIFYIVFYQLIVRKSYQVQTPVTGANTIVSVFPSAAERPPSGPYCAGINTSSQTTSISGYNRIENSTYSWGAGPALQRLPCYRWDDADVGSASASSASSDLFIPL